MMAKFKTTPPKITSFSKNEVLNVISLPRKNSQNSGHRFGGFVEKPLG